MWALKKSNNQEKPMNHYTKGTVARVYQTQVFPCLIHPGSPDSNLVPNFRYLRKFAKLSTLFDTWKVEFQISNLVEFPKLLYA